MLPADYVTDVEFKCETCDVIGRLENVGSGVIARLMRAHVRVGHGVLMDFANVRSKRDYLLQRRRERNAR